MPITLSHDELGIVSLLKRAGIHDSASVLAVIMVTREHARPEGRNKSDKTDRLDAEHAEFHKRVRDAYLRLAAEEPERFRIVDTRGWVEETHARVKEIVVPFLEHRGQLVLREPAAVRSGPAQQNV